MSNIEQNLQKILSAVYGEEVREAIHDSIHDCYEDGKAGAVDLTAREQIANLVANAGDGTKDSEVVDARVGYDGTKYKSLGEAVREQTNSLKKSSLLFYDKLTYTDDYFIRTNMPKIDLTPNRSEDWKYCIVDAKEGDVFRVNGEGGDNPRLWAFIDSENNLLSNANSMEEGTDITIIAPENTSKLIVNVYKRISIDSYYVGNIIDVDVIYIAASDSRKKDKEMSTIVCSGTEDQNIFNDIIRILSKNGGGKLILRQGRYILNNYNVNGSRNCIDLDVGSSLIEIEGELVNYNRNASEGQEYNTGAQFYMTDELYEKSLTLTRYKVINCSSDNQDGGLVLKNFGIIIPHNQKEIIGIDFYDFNGLLRVKGLYLNCYNKTHEPNVSVGEPPAKAAYNCIGIRTICKTSIGAIGTIFQECVVKGFWEGIAVNSEHVVLDRCASVYCVFGYTFGHYNVMGEAAQHPNLLFRCMDERNISLPRFYENINDQAVIILGLNIERKEGNTPGGELGEYAYEINPGSWYGEITYTIATGKTTKNDYDTPFWKDGNGHGFKTKNLLHLQACDTETRKKYKPNFMQKIFDTTLNKEVICVDETESGRWVDVLGNDV